MEYLSVFLSYVLGIDIYVPGVGMEMEDISQDMVRPALLSTDTSYSPN